jgi:hypothetical protein
VSADITVRRADPAEADQVGALTERVYRAGGFGSDDYARVLRDGRSRVRDGIVLVAASDGVILCTETGMHAAQRLYERRGYLREPARDWQIRNVRLLAYRLALSAVPVKAGAAPVRPG